MGKRALIIGILGQDGSFMADLLVSKGYEVLGLVRSNNGYLPVCTRTRALEKKHPQVALHSLGMRPELDILHILMKCMPDEIYNFAGVSNVFNPYEDIHNTVALNCELPSMILEAIVKVNKDIRYFQASSCLIFGRDTSGTQNELTTLNPIHPYGVTKMCTDILINEFRRVHNIFACSGIFFNHESERRDPRFFTRKVTSTLAKIKAGHETELRTGSLDVKRDFGYAPDFMEAAFLMLQNKEPKDYVIGTGELTSLDKWVRMCVEYAGLDMSVIKEDTKEVRAQETGILRADYSEINKDLGWAPKHTVEEMARIMTSHDIKLYA